MDRERRKRKQKKHNRSRDLKEGCAGACRIPSLDVHMYNVHT